MELLDVQAFTSPNIYSLDQDVIQMRVKLGKLMDTPTKDIPGFNEKIIEYFPGLAEHKCAKGYRGGFIDRLKEGTYLAHVCEHLCLEIQNMLGCNVNYGKARNETEDIYKIIFACLNTTVGKACGYFIHDLVSRLINNEESRFEEGCRSLRQIHLACNRGVSTGAIYEEAEKRGIPAGEIAGSSLIRLGYGKYQKYISATLFENTSSIAVDIAYDKALTKTLLNEVSIPIPEGQVCLTLQDAVRAAGEIGYPVVVKPKSGNKGKYVAVNILNQSDLKKAFSDALLLGPEVIVEKYVSGKEYRILVINGRTAAVAQRMPAEITGDGLHTIEELIELENKNELRGDDHEKPLTKIKIDSHVKEVIGSQHFSLESIPEAGQVIRLRNNSNLSTGGTAIDFTDDIHPCNKKIAELAVNTIGLDIAGVDMVIPDISKPIRRGFGAVVEVNAAPGIRMHLSPTQGQKRDVVSPILDMIYPPGRKFAVPIIAVTGTNGKTTTTRMINHILKLNGLIVGMTTTHGIYLNGKCLEHGDTTGYKSARRILNNRSIDVALLETARGGILKKGLAYKKADIAVFTNLSNDHLGIDGIKNLEELFHIKSLVTEAVKPDGYCVLNADDPWTLKAGEKAGGNVILFSLKNDNPHLISHIDTGGRAVFLKNDSIYWAKSGQINYVIDVKSIPATLEGILKHNIYNCLAATGAACALGIPLININKALRSFSCAPEINPGRFNIYNLSNFRVVLDYGHNYDGYQVTIDALKLLKASTLAGIIGVPGDRRNEDIIAIGKLSGQAFNRLIIKEDKDLRERNPFEVARLLKTGALLGGIKEENIRIIPNEEIALEFALTSAREGEVIAMFFEEMDPLISIIKKYQARISSLTNQNTQNCKIAY